MGLAREKGAFKSELKCHILLLSCGVWCSTVVSNNDFSIYSRFSYKGQCMNWWRMVLAMLCL